MDKPKCPWCGEEMEFMSSTWSYNARTGPYLKLMCANRKCPVKPFMTVDYQTRESAIRAWNTRAVDLRLDKWLQHRCELLGRDIWYEIRLMGYADTINGPNSARIATLQSLIDLLNERES